MNNASHVLHINHARWNEFIETLCGALGPDDCRHTFDLSKKILSGMDGVDVDRTLDYCRQRGGHCDCEIIMNVTPLQEPEYD